jgi:hypothetical protein
MGCRLGAAARESRLLGEKRREAPTDQNANMRDFMCRGSDHVDSIVKILTRPNNALL